LPEAENQGVSEAVASDAEANKQAARSMLEAGSTIEEVMASTGLGRNQILGLKGSMVKANKRSIKVSGEPSDSLGKADQEEATLVNDLRDEAKLDGAALIAARNRNRLKREGPEIYGQLHGGQQSEANSPAAKLIDLEIIRQLRDMRLSEEHRNNGGGVEATETLNLRKEIDVLREEMHKKDVEALKKETEKLAGEIGELRADLRSSAGSNSDLAIVFKESKDLISQIVTHDGPLRNYLLPDVNIKPAHEAPELRRQVVEDGRPSVASVLAKHGLVTKVLERPS